jgi:hypothetical protein
MAAEMPIERQRPREEGKAEAVVDHGKRPEVSVRRWL